MQEATTFNIYDVLSFHNLATALISVFTLRYGPALLFRGPYSLCTLFYKNCVDHIIKFPLKTAQKVSKHVESVDDDDDDNNNNDNNNNCILL
jgi:hypothetical protein